MNVFTFIITLVGMIFLFITFWIVLALAKDHLKRPRKGKPVADHDLERLAAMADSLGERIEVLESIIDAEVPDWREQHEPAS